MSLSIYYADDGEKEITMKAINAEIVKYYSINSGLSYNANPQYMGRADVRFTFDDGTSRIVTLIVDYCPSTHATQYVVPGDMLDQNLTGLEHSPMYGGSHWVYYEGPLQL